MAKPLQTEIDEKVTTDPLIPIEVRTWIGESLAALQAEAQILVDDYWAQLKDKRTGKKAYEIGKIGVRLRPRETGSFSIEWFRMGKLGNGKGIATRGFRKGRAHMYPVDQMLTHEPEWLGELVRSSEQVFSEIRKKQMLLAEIRNALAEYASHVSGKPVTAAMLVGEFLPAGNQRPKKEEAA